MSSQPTSKTLDFLASLDHASVAAGIRERMYRTAYRGERVGCMNTGGVSGDRGPQLCYYAAKIGANMLVRSSG